MHVCVRGGWIPWGYPGLFTVRDSARGSDQDGSIWFQKLVGRVGSGRKLFEISPVRSGRVGPGRVGLGGLDRVGSGQVGSDRVGSGRAGPGQEIFRSHGSSRATLT